MSIKLSSIVISKLPNGGQEIIIHRPEIVYPIPPVIIYCEDKFTIKVLSAVMSYYDMNHGSFNIIPCGSWINIVISCFGSLLYRHQMDKLGNPKLLEIIGIIDGDIPTKEISGVIKKTYKGGSVPEDLKILIPKVQERIISFNLPNLDEIPTDIIGKPEYYIKQWLEEITDLINGPNSQLSDSVKKELSIIIEISQNIKIPIKNNKKDYHNYFKLMNKKIKSHFFLNFSMPHETEYFLLRIIYKYNPKRWEEYSNPIYLKLKDILQIQRKNFSQDTFNNQILP